jgi:hypothetical protein
MASATFPPGCRTRRTSSDATAWHTMCELRQPAYRSSVPTAAFGRNFASLRRGTRSQLRSNGWSLRL